MGMKHFAEMDEMKRKFCGDGLDGMGRGENKVRWDGCNIFSDAGL